MCAFCVRVRVEGAAHNVHSKEERRGPNLGEEERRRNGAPPPCFVCARSLQEEFYNKIIIYKELLVSREHGYDAWANVALSNKAYLSMSIIEFVLFILSIFRGSENQRHLC